jgi:hypothetical protein
MALAAGSLLRYHLTRYVGKHSLMSQLGDRADCTLIREIVNLRVSDNVGFICFMWGSGVA